MKTNTKFILYFIVFALFSGCQTPEKRSPQSVDDDPYIYLEQGQSPQVEAWVDSHNIKSTQILKESPYFTQITNEVRPILMAKDRIPSPFLTNGMIRNFWQDEDHVRGVLRQTTPSSYRKKNPDWDIILDVDNLNKIENKSWVYEGSECLPPEFNLCMISLSDGGKDSNIVREFDISKKSFVKGGFEIPEAKSNFTWIDKDTLTIGTDFGADSLTTSGYPRVLKLWKRGTPLGDGKLVFAGDKSDVSVSAVKIFRTDSQHVYISKSLNFFEEEVFIYSDQKLTQIPLPSTSQIRGEFKGYIIAKLRSPWVTESGSFTAGSIVTLPFSAVTKANASSYVKLLFSPDRKTTLQDLSTTKNYLYLNLLKDVQGEIQQVTLNEDKWSFKKVNLPKKGTVGVIGTNDFDDRLFLTYQSFTKPPTLFEANGHHLVLKKVKELSPQYDSSQIVVEQFFVPSLDQTKIPYFVVHKKGMALNGLNPTLLYAYGGFEISEVPFYSGTVGKVWLEKGGVYVVANIRGGGEYGPQWHEAALKTNRQRAYEDFFSVTQDLFKRKITNPNKLGIMGGSNGGLLMGVALTQHPEFYKAIVCESALLDMIRYTKMPPGASWIGEYGDPEIPEMYSAISKYSPYQNIKPNANYPQIFFHVSTADDRVLPGHSRKMAARLEESGYDILFFENTEGGHGGAADLKQKVDKTGLEYSYLYSKLMP